MLILHSILLLLRLILNYYSQLLVKLDNDTTLRHSLYWMYTCLLLYYMYTWLFPHLYKINGMWNKWNINELNLKFQRFSQQSQSSTTCMESFIYSVLKCCLLKLHTVVTQSSELFVGWSCADYPGIRVTKGEKLRIGNIQKYHHSKVTYNTSEPKDCTEQ